MQHIHLDTDLGGDIDDLYARAPLLSRPDVEITRTTVLEAGGRRAVCVRAALELAGLSDVPITAGARAHLQRIRLPVGIPPRERYWPQHPPSIPTSLIGPYTHLSPLEDRFLGIRGDRRLWLMDGKLSSPPLGFLD